MGDNNMVFVDGCVIIKDHCDDGSVLARPKQQHNSYTCDQREGVVIAFKLKITDDGLLFKNRVFVGGLAPETTELDLEILFSEHGFVTNVRIVQDRISGKSKGFGFIEYQDEETSKKLIEKGLLEYKGRKLRLRPAIRKKSSGQFGRDSSESCPETRSTYVVPHNYYVVDQQYNYQPLNSQSTGGVVYVQNTVPVIYGTSFNQPAVLQTPNYMTTAMPYQATPVYYCY